MCQNGHCGVSLQDTETRPVDKKDKKIHFCSLLEMFGLSFTLNGSMCVCAVFYLYSNSIRKFRIDFVLLLFRPARFLSSATTDFPREVLGAI